MTQHKHNENCPHDHNCGHDHHHHHDHNCGHDHHHHENKPVATPELFVHLVAILEKKAPHSAKKLYEDILLLCKDEHLAHDLGHIRPTVEKKLADLQNSALKNKLTGF